MGLEVIDNCHGLFYRMYRDRLAETYPYVNGTFACFRSLLLSAFLLDCIPLNAINGAVNMAVAWKLVAVEVAWKWAAAVESP